jgi:aminomethyltransferase
MTLKTPLYDSHVARDGRMVEFAGFLMPVTFEGIVAEHETVRTKVGLFDVSHMGEIYLTGPGAVDFADHAVTNSVAGLDEGQICYTVCCNEKGNVLDDLLVYRFSDEKILFVVNAVNTGKIFEHLKSLAPGNIEVENSTDRIGQIAVQGPASRELLLSDPFFSRVAAGIEGLDYYRFFTFEHEGEEIILSRTGYTGELGYEIYLPASIAKGVWDRLLDGGEELGAAPIGLGARDTLRFEPGYCLYGHELDENTSPLEAGLSWIVKLKKGEFIGREALAKEKETKPARKLIGLEVTGKGIPRQGFSVHYDGETVGSVTSGTFSPTLKKALAMALVKRSVPKEAEGITIDIRGRAASAVRRSLPFYKGSVND